MVIEANGKPIETFEQLRNVVGLLHIGDTVQLKLLRDGNEKLVNVTVGKSNEAAAAAKSLHPALEGATFVPFSGGDDGTPGVQVQTIQPGSPAAETGLQPGDVIVEINKHPIKSMEDFRKYAGIKDGNLMLLVRRGSGAFFLLLQP